MLIAILAAVMLLCLGGAMIAADRIYDTRRAPRFERTGQPNDPPAG